VLAERLKQPLCFYYVPLLPPIKILRLEVVIEAEESVLVLGFFNIVVWMVHGIEIVNLIQYQVALNLPPQPIQQYRPLALRIGWNRRFPFSSRRVSLTLSCLSLAAGVDLRGDARFRVEHDGTLPSGQPRCSPPLPAPRCSPPPPNLRGSSSRRRRKTRCSPFRPSLFPASLRRRATCAAPPCLRGLVPPQSCLPLPAPPAGRVTSLGGPTSVHRFVVVEEAPRRGPSHAPTKFQFI
jgi:hypothetical protein